MKELIHRIITYLQEQYATVLAILAVIAAINYYIVIDKLGEQEGSAVLVKLSADQSNLVNTINFLTVETAFADEKRFSDNKSALIKHKSELTDNHQSLRTGDRFLRKDGRVKRIESFLPVELRQVYFDEPVGLDKRMTDYINALNAVLRLKYGELNKQTSELKTLHKIVTPKLLSGLEKVSLYYLKQSEFIAGQAINLQNLSFFGSGKYISGI